jgi:hypothetical protein
MAAAMEHRQKLPRQNGGEEINQRQLAIACNVKPPSVNGWFSGETKSLKGDTAVKAARYLMVRAEWLATGIGPMKLDGNPQAKPDEHHAPHVSEPIAAYGAPKQPLLSKKTLTVGPLLQAISRATRSVPDKKKDAINSLASAGEITDADAALIDGIAGGVTVDLCVSAEQAEELDHLRLWKDSVFGLAQTWRTRAERAMLAEFLAEVDQLIREKYQVSSGAAAANSPPVRNPHK